ncbi:DNA internalization-related competence protein ComEC/Rec2 [Variovorax sp. PCZ-1]|nr:DNA internalization-related competence protein ComEC/Rec2 [Variovorax sp. PCZ-1]MBS7807295.1 DNA internalization-related competence protein ComEC/Rec2 [Variovorax sp. PCZ-1]
MLYFSLPLLAFVLGCAVQLQQRELFSTWIYGAFGLFAGVVTARSAIQFIVKPIEPQANITRMHAAAGLLILCIAAAVLGFTQTGWRAAAYASQALSASLEGADIRITGVIAAMPQRDESGMRFRLDVESAQLLKEGDAVHVRLAPRVQLSWYRSLPRLSEDAAIMPFAELQSGSGEIKAGERWQMVARLKAPHGNLNPHSFDYELWLWEQGIAATGYVRATPREAARGDGPVKIGETWQHPLEAARQKVRDAIFERVSSPQLAGVVAALAVGDQAAIERADWDIYRATGVAHLMSISGLHITMFAWGAALLIGSLWRRSMRLTTWRPAQHAALIGGVVLATAYALFAGWGVPAQRTVWMLGAVAILKLSGKQWPWPLVWLLVLALIVALDPWALLSAGFWLSFVAVGILFASDAGRDRLHSAHAPQSMWQRLQTMLREQWVITLALAPLSLLLFNQVSFVGLVANALAIPWVTLVATPLALLGVIAPPAWEVAALCVQAMGVMLSWLAQLPFATVSVASSAGLLPAIAIFGALLLVLKLPLPLRFAGAVMILPMLLVSPPRPAQGEFALLGADIGQGNAILVQTANHSLLYDTGPRFSRESDAGQRTLVPLLRALGERLDVLMISHRDADHIGGAAAVLKMQPQARLISSIEAEHELQQIRTAQRCEAGQRWQWDGVDFEILHPQPADYDLKQKPNAISCVLRISNGKQSALLTGDLEATQELRLVSDQAKLKADLLLVPHHGSKTSSRPEFLDAVQARIALVQAGYRNRFQHPVPEVMVRYQERGIQVIDSARCGAAHWRSAEPQTIRCERDMHKRYWHHRLP